MTSFLNQLLDRLDDAKRQFEPGTHKTTEQLLARISRQDIRDAEALIRLHEELLFICAYPQSARARRLAESLLRSFGLRVADLREAEEDLSPLDPPDVSGIAGTSVTDTFSYPIVRWLVNRNRGRVQLDWADFESENRIAETWPRFIPLVEEDSSVEANVPYQEWLRTAAGRANKELRWLVRRFESLPVSEKEKAELYNSQQLYVNWEPAYRATRTGMRLPVKNVFYHREPLLRRRDVSFERELESGPPKLTRLSQQEGEAILDMAREASTTRYRELYGFTHGDSQRVFRANVGRGVDIFIMGLPAERRLPLRAYHAATIFKNGVPVGYFEGLSLFERMESGFNLYYTFRDGETAWLYARTLNVFRHLLRVTAFSLDPYQIGYENEEGIESGAFWFYRKLGFRSTARAAMELTTKEEARLAQRGGHRTSTHTLKRLAESSMIFELDRSKQGDWDRFQIRNLGLRAARMMADKFQGDAQNMQSDSIKRLARLLGVDIGSLRKTQLAVFSDFAVTMALVPELNNWTRNEKQLLLQIIRAKAGADEGKYLKLMQRHVKFRAALVKLGS
ncbi:MAG TPA: hypothetical protein VGW36_00325 [Pyrinomonadaceae bacterium]|nr:hypothetical protein [Pyrinomonadaceae bacterium]